MLFDTPLEESEGVVERLAEGVVERLAEGVGVIPSMVFIPF
jgi:hypothetical protein